MKTISKMKTISQRSLGDALTNAALRSHYILVAFYISLANRRGDMSRKKGRRETEKQGF